jgi:hypothetical protein
MAEFTRKSMQRISRVVQHVEGTGLVHQGIRRKKRILGGATTDAPGLASVKHYSSLTWGPNDEGFSPSIQSITDVGGASESGSTGIYWDGDVFRSSTGGTYFVLLTVVYDEADNQWTHCDPSAAGSGSYLWRNHQIRLTSDHGEFGSDIILVENFKALFDLRTQLRAQTASGVVSIEPDDSGYISGGVWRPRGSDGSNWPITVPADIDMASHMMFVKLNDEWLAGAAPGPVTVNRITETGDNRITGGSDQRVTEWSD